LIQLPTGEQILTLASEGKAEELYTNLKQRALGSLYFFSKVVLNYRDLANLHVEFCKRVQYDIEQRKRGYLMPRGHFKSTIVSKSHPLWRLCQDPEKRILIVGESDTVAAKNLRDVKWHLQNNQMLKWLFPEIIPPDINKTKWTDTEILLPRQGTYDESSITTVGVGAKTTGFHFDIIVYDDMIGEKAAKSEAEMNSAIEWFQFAPGLLNDPATGEELLIGTRWKHGMADLYGYIMDQLQGSEQESGRKVGFTWYVRAALEDENGVPDRENGTPIFPERFTRETLEEIALREGEYKFSCQYMNNPIAPGATDFDPSWINYYTVDADHKTMITSDGTPSTRMTSLHRISFYDPSAGGKSAKAQNAIVVIGCDYLRRIFVIDNWGANCSIGDAIEKWHTLNDRYKISENWYEEVGAQKTVTDIIRERLAQGECRYCHKVHNKLFAKPFHPPAGKGEMNKKERIIFFAQPPFQEGRVYLRQGAFSSALKNQIIVFPHGRLVDLFDALASAIHKARYPKSEEDIASDIDERERMREARLPRTNTEYNYGGYI
jgi:hypothetical protein